MNLREIYNLLLAGKVVRLSFASEQEKETFRVKLYKFKKSQEHAMMQIGMIEEDSIQALSFNYEAGVTVIKLIKKRGLRDYNVIILEDDDGQAADSEETLPRDLGTGTG